MSEVQIRVKSPVSSAIYSLEASKEDPVSLTREYLQSLDVLSQPVSAFLLKYKGEAVSGDAQLGELDPDATTFEFEMQLESLNFTDVTFQIQQLREVFGLTSLGSTHVNAGATRLHEIKRGSKKGKKLSEDDIAELAGLPESAVGSAASPENKRPFVSHPNPLIPKPSAVELKLSKWQSICRSPRLKLQGIIALVTLVSNDGKEWGFAATPAGFVTVPDLTERNFVLPSSSARAVPTLLQAIELVSPSTISVARKNSEKIQTNPLGCVAVPQISSVAPWLVGDSPSITSMNASKLEVGVETSWRDWNEDYQSTREMVAESFSERITRDRSLCVIASDFATAATEGATKVVERALTALNPYEEEETAKIYLHNGIFYTHGADFEQAYAGIASGHDARKAVKKGIPGVEQLMVLNEPELCPVLTAVVDYCGRRILAQAPVPGIFREIPLMEYGQSEDREVVHFNEDIDKNMQKYASNLYLKPHPVTPEGLQLQTSVEVHAARSTDGRVYAIDLHRMQVPDLLFEGSSELDLLRTEAVVDFFSKNPDADRLNPDVWLPVDRYPKEYAKAELSKDIEAAKAVARHVRETLAPSLVNDIVNGTGVDPLDGVHLTALMHRKGINMRHLGLIHKLATESGLKNLSAVALEEALARSLKNLLNEQLAALPKMTDVVAIVEAFVAGFRGSKEDATLVSAVEKRLQNHFGFSVLPNNWRATHLPRLTLLRLLSLKCGLQWDENLKLVAINPLVRYSFPRSVTASEAIEAGSLSLQSALQSTASEEDNAANNGHDNDENVDESGKTQGNGSTSQQDSATNEKTDAAVAAAEEQQSSSNSSPEPSAEASSELLDQTLAVLSQAVGIYTQIYGPAHAEVAHILNQVATTFFEYSNDTKKAIDYSRQAITIAERVKGIDSFDAITMYNNLAHFERSAGNFEATLELAKRTIALVEQLSWPGFSDRSATYVTVAVMLLQSKKKKLQTASLDWFAKAIELAKDSPGGPSGLLWFNYAQAQLFQEDYKNAARSMEASYQVFKSKNGADDPSAKEVKGYLESLLKITVNSAQNAKKAPTLAAMPHAQLSSAKPKRTEGITTDSKSAPTAKKNKKKSNNKKK